MAIESRQGAQLLINIAFSAIVAAGLLEEVLTSNELDIGAFARQDRLFYIIGEAAAVEIRGQQVGAAGIKLV